MIRRVKNIAGMLLISGMLLCTGCGSSPAQDTTTTQATTESGVATEEASSEQTQEDIQESVDIAAKPEAAYSISIKKNNSWEQDGLKCAQYDGVIKNYTGAAGTDWSVNAVIPEGAQMKDSWNGNYELKGTQLSISAVDYNKEIAGNSELTFGFILGTREEFEMKEVTLSIGDEKYAMTNQDEQKEVEKKDDVAEQDSTSEQVTTEAAKDEVKDNKPKETGTPVANHGRLAVKGTDLVDQSGKNYQLKGVSTHGLAWFPEYVNKEAFASLSKYGVNAMRLAMYTDEGGGYCNGGDRNKLEQTVFDGVEACKELGMYVIIDWHVLREGDPNKYKEDAKKFFDMVSKKYADYDNVIYEICNEPCNGTTWEQIKAYAQEVIPVIRKNDSKAVIIIGTPNWSQDVEIASQNPVTGYDNLMYAVHFYAATHKDQIRDKVVTARKNGLPVIVSECSICEASGNGTVDYAEAEKWMNYINESKMSMFAWNLSNKDEKSSLLKPGVIKKDGFEMDDFSETGLWFMEQYSK